MRGVAPSWSRPRRDPLDLPDLEFDDALNQTKEFLFRYFGNVNDWPVFPQNPGERSRAMGPVSAVRGRLKKIAGLTLE